MKRKKKEYKTVMDLLQKIKIKEDFSNVNGLFRELFQLSTSLWMKMRKRYSNQRNESFYQIEKGKEVYHLPIDGFDGDIHDENIVCHWNATIRRRWMLKRTKKNYKNLRTKLIRVKRGVGKT